jgi:glycosyltransferase involved in cell wall biosynthesis
LRLLYVAHRINASDGSGVHCRAFVENARRLGHEVETFPQVEDFAKGSSQGDDSFWERIGYYFGKLSHKKVIYFLERIMKHENEIVFLIDGMIDSLREFLLLIKIVHQFSPDVILYRDVTFRFSPYWISKIYRIPLVVEVNFLRSVETKLFDKQNKISLITRWAEKTAMRSGKFKFCVSKEMKHFIEKYCEASEVAIIPNGVDTNKFDINSFDKKSIKDRLNLTGKKVLGYVGSYQPWHGVDIALRVIEILSARNEGYHLLLIGNGWGYSAIRNEIISKNLGSVVTQLDKIPHEDIARYMASFDYALMSYPDIKDFHGSPLKLFEYMAMSIPVVATNIGQLGEIISHGHTGYLVYPPTPENFSQAIINADSIETDREKIGLNTRELMEEKYSWLSNAKSVVSLCERAFRECGGLAEGQRES